MQTMGRDGLGWTPFLLSLFIFVYLCNLPASSRSSRCRPRRRIAIPLFLALVVWVIYNVVGFKHQGIGATSRDRLARRACRRRSTPARRPIEFISTFLVRPFSLAVRLFANMLAGHCCS